MIGNLHHRLTIQEQHLTPDNAGGFTQTWENVTAHPVVYAAVLPVSGAGRFVGGKTETVVTHKIVLRYRTDIVAGMRLCKGSRIFSIVSVLNLGEQNRFLEVLAEEIAV